MCYLNPYVRHKMLCSLLRRPMVPGFHADQSNVVLCRQLCRSLLLKDSHPRSSRHLLQRLTLIRFLLVKGQQLVNPILKCTTDSQRSLEKKVEEIDASSVIAIPGVAMICILSPLHLSEIFVMFKGSSNGRLTLFTFLECVSFSYACIYQCQDRIFARMFLVFFLQFHLQSLCNHFMSIPTSEVASR